MTPSDWTFLGIIAFATAVFLAFEGPFFWECFREAALKPFLQWWLDKLED